MWPQLVSRLTSIGLTLSGGRPDYRRIARDTVKDHFARRPLPGERCETVHPEAIAYNPLPRNVARPDDLPDDRGWWGYSFRDVPARVSGETFIATLRDCTVVWYRDAARHGDFFPAVLGGAGRALDLREMRFRPPHADVLRQARPARVDRAIWIAERVYHNHSHWLTAHLPKLLLLRERGLLDEVLLPPERTPAIDGSLRRLGLAPERFRTFDPAQPLRVGTLTLLGTDRFRPELLRLVPEAYGVAGAPPPRRRIFISRARASRRRLVNEEAIRPLLDAAGFERVCMEALSFDDQVALMRDTAVLFAPHGAGLTNMMFCPTGADVIEIADLGFPNPNFYALASAMGHRYWLLPGTALGDCHPLEKDLHVEPAAVRDLLSAALTAVKAGA